MFLYVFLFVESTNGSTSAESENDGRTPRTKRKASPEKKAPRKRARVVGSDAQNTFKEEDLRIKMFKRKVREDGEGLCKKQTKKRKHTQDDNETASTSTDTGNKESENDGRTPRTKRKASPEKKAPRKRARVVGSNPQNTFKEEDLRIKMFNRKVREDGEGLCKKQTKKRNHTQDDNETASTSTDTGNKESKKDNRTPRTKRKASPEKKAPRKRARVVGSDPQNTFKEEDLRIKMFKRKVREDGEGLCKKQTKKRKHTQDDNETASTSTDTGRESSSNPLEGCSTALGDVRRMSGKRKAAADVEQPIRKRKRIPDLNENKTTKRDLKRNSPKAQYKAKYKQQKQLGEGGCGAVYAGYRIADKLPVAIKHIPKDKVFCKLVDDDGKQLSVEVAVMLKLEKETTGPEGSTAPVSLLDWYDLDQELILVLERPVPSEDLQDYIDDNGGCLPEEEAKVILKQLVNAAKHLEDNCIFHRDIKVENILIETGSDFPRARLIDFGLSCFVKQKSSYYRVFYGTPAHIPPEWYSRCTYRAGPTTVWQLGVVLFESVHRKSSFETNMFIRKKIKISNKLSEDCQDFLQICLTKVPERRPTLEQLQLHPWLR
uniref:non-specific serine/threonine protein kinase n=1 Tax=Dicentrarchus labrax TaxID=13489 RepID=A0A8P4GJI7_DICLA